FSTSAPLQRAALGSQPPRLAGSEQRDEAQMKPAAQSPLPTQGSPMPAPVGVVLAHAKHRTATAMLRITADLQTGCADRARRAAWATAPAVREAAGPASPGPRRAE